MGFWRFFMSAYLKEDFKTSVPNFSIADCGIDSAHSTWRDVEGWVDVQEQTTDRGDLRAQMRFISPSGRK